MGYLLKRVCRNDGAAIAVDPQERLCRLAYIDVDVAGGAVDADAFDPRSARTTS